MRERKAVILDYLHHGYPGMKKIEPLAQAIGFNHFTLLEVVVAKEVRPGEIVMVDNAEIVSGIRRKLNEKDLTNFAKGHLEDQIAQVVRARENEFVTFFNRATRLSIRTHQLELLPGIGKKHIQIILKERKNPFKSFEDIKKRAGMTVDIDRLIAKRIATEIKGDEKNNLFLPKRMP